MSNPRLFCRPPDPTGGPHELAPHEAFNFYCYKSILVLDTSIEPGPRLPGSAWCDTSLPLLRAAAAARDLVMEEFTPDRSQTALLLYTDHKRMDQVARWLLDEHCSCVRCVRRDELVARHDILFVASVSDLPVFPSIIVPNRLFLGPASCANEAVLDQLQITHVVSVVERNMQPPFGRSHLLCQIPDDDDAQLAPVLSAALPFIAAALTEPDGRVLVHCERGASRSVSVVVAHLMAQATRDGAAGDAQPLVLADALDLVKAQRPCAQPNCGFLRQLEQLDDAAFLKLV